MHSLSLLAAGTHSDCHCPISSRGHGPIFLEESESRASCLQACFVGWILVSETGSGLLSHSPNRPVNCSWLTGSSSVTACSFIRPPSYLLPLLPHGYSTMSHSQQKNAAFDTVNRQQHYAGHLQGLNAYGACEWSLWVVVVVVVVVRCTACAQSHSKYAACVALCVTNHTCRASPQVCE